MLTFGGFVKQLTCLWATQLHSSTQSITSAPRWQDAVGGRRFPLKKGPFSTRRRLKFLLSKTNPKTFSWSYFSQSKTSRKNNKLNIVRTVFFRFLASHRILLTPSYHTVAGQKWCFSMFFLSGLIQDQYRGNSPFFLEAEKPSRDRSMVDIGSLHLSNRTVMSPKSWLSQYPFPAPRPASLIDKAFNASRQTNKRSSGDRERQLPEWTTIQFVTNPRFRVFTRSALYIYGIWDTSCPACHCWVLVTHFADVQ